VTLLQALLLGIVEGITEFLPVSSTGHLLFVQRLLGIQSSEAADAFAICIQGGAILAVLGLYRGRAIQTLRGLTGRDPEGLKLGINLVVAFLPAAVIGALFNKAIERVLFGLWPVATAWFIGGVAILAVSRWYQRREQGTGLALTALPWQSALIIGFAQVVAMWPGTSRSLMTLLAGLACGLSISAAVEFSFLLGVLTLGAASAYKLLKSGHVMLEAYGPVTLAIGFIAAWIFAVIAVRWMVTYLRTKDLSVFGYWRIGLAVVTAALLATNVIQP
jgi:undecaprenyl-diphosphatase